MGISKYRQISKKGKRAGLLGPVQRLPEEDRKKWNQYANESEEVHTSPQHSLPSETSISSQLLSLSHPS